MRLRREADEHGSPVYTVMTAAGLVLGTVRRERSSKARNVKGVGGVTRWVAGCPDEEVVSRVNTYTRADAIEQLEAHYFEQHRG